MGSYQIDTDSRPGVLHFTLEGTLTVDDVHAFVSAHNAAVDHFGARDYVVFGDIRSMRPLSPEATEVMERAKRHSASKRNFRGSAILVKDAVVALQHRRTSIHGGVMPTEIISSSEEECIGHLEKLRHR